MNENERCMERVQGVIVITNTASDAFVAFYLVPSLRRSLRYLTRSGIAWEDSLREELSGVSCL